MRLAKYLGHCGICSRKQASRLIEQGEVTVNGRLADHIDHVLPSDEIIVAGQKIVGPTEKQLFAYHKPVGIDCKLNLHDPTSLVHSLPKHTRLYPIGRLDKDSRGLLLITNDGELCHRLNHPDSHVEKEYHVTLDRAFDERFCQKMAKGIPVDGQITLPCEVTPLSTRQFRIVLKQGLNRQIRKMAKYCGYRVIDLMRVRIGAFQLELHSLPESHFIEIPIHYFDI
ncbi:Similar to ribosomal large subunit pseudouridine synthase F, group RluF2 [Pseudoalteromonas luteoviolacea B = ATCC 29581]|nr:Similar to ribosomal large subunit pseudouridine synthase F, group RluF2 [Pseudoalteromonas luteoviolacea B = ATCC 29581]